MSADDLRLKRAVNTACKIAEAQGLQFEKAFIFVRPLINHVYIENHSFLELN
ncbi:hypothetical protein [Trichormus azollae]|jgi:hypothetical protein|uniref:Uncharacterized protein n=1 Tax=Nostoc azollae (strain 0708) TaxID=551115 RepID=D7E5M5_NOSA0|nr:hypothetical protein [Trichormus azollae]ADI66284.1 hypothetical protein Aazo_5283 ['Nostoc azollae' 0708]